MNRPINRIVRMRLAQQFQRKTRCSPAESVARATVAIEFMYEAGLDVVLPGWIPVNDDTVGAQPIRRSILSWEDLPPIPTATIERKPWRGPDGPG